jgi:hypothetical protein
LQLAELKGTGHYEENPSMQIVRRQNCGPQFEVLRAIGKLFVG